MSSGIIEDTSISCPHFLNVAFTNYELLSTTVPNLGVLLLSQSFVETISLPVGTKMIFGFLYIVISSIPAHMKRDISAGVTTSFFLAII